MTERLPVLLVVVPLLAAPLCVLLRRPEVAWLSYLGAAIFTLFAAATLLAAVTAGAALPYAIGGWEPPYGIAYVVDSANAPVLLLVSLLGVAAGLYARQSVAREIEPSRIYLFYACLSLYLSGLLGIAVTGDAFNVFVFLEISSLSGYAMIALGRRRQALLAAVRYLVIGTVGGTFLLIGLGLMYATTGTLNMADLAERLPALQGNRALTAALGFISVGLAIKAAVFPLHAWQPDAYAEAPAALTVLMAGAGAKVAIYAWLRFGFGLFGFDTLAQGLPLTHFVLALGVAAMLVGAAAACVQTDLRRLLAWSSVSQVGYIVAGIGLANDAGLRAAMLHLLIHGLIKAALFGVAGVLLLRLGSTRIADLAGTARRMPLAFALLVIGGLGLIGVPLTAGFVSKWALAEALIAGQQWVVLGAVLLSSLLALIYVGRVLEAAWFGSTAAEFDARRTGAMTAVPVSLTLLCTVVAVWPGPVAQWATRAAATLLGTGP
jgi:multicomponent Na+:H+ antiporter subunit D